MDYVVIVCPYCKRVKGVNLVQKCTRCIHCGKVLSLKKLKILYKTSSQEKLRIAIGHINAEIHNDIKKYEKIFLSKNKK